MVVRRYGPGLGYAVCQRTRCCFIRYVACQHNGCQYNKLIVLNCLTCSERLFKKNWRGWVSWQYVSINQLPLLVYRILCAKLSIMMIIHLSYNDMRHYSPSLYISYSAGKVINYVCEQSLKSHNPFAHCIYWLSHRRRRRCSAAAPTSSSGLKALSLSPLYISCPGVERSIMLA